MRRLVLLILLVVALPCPAPADLSQRLADLRARSLPDSVEIIVEQQLPAAHAATDRAGEQMLLLERGMTRIAYGRPADGEADLRQVLALAEARGDAPATLKAMRYLAEACSQLGRRDESAQLFRDLERRARAARDSYHAGKALYGLGRLRYRARDLAGADSLYSAALPFLAAAGDSADLAALYNGLGNCRGGRGAYRNAAGHYAQAAIMARGGKSRSLEAMATNNLAGIEMILGDPGAAVDGYRRARDIQRELGLWQQVGAPWRNLVQALTEQGRHDEARTEAEAALAFSRERGFRDEEAYTLVRLAEVDLAMGRPAEALGRCREALGLGPEIALDVRGNARMRAAEALLALDRGPAALAELDSAATLLTGKDDFILAMMLATDRGHVLRALGRHAQAIEATTPALARSAQAGVARYRLPLLVGAARSWLALSQLDSTRVCLAAAERLWEQERALPADPEWRERRGAEAQQLFATEVSLASAGGDLPAAFAAVQRYKARTLLERILGPGEELPAIAEVPAPVTLLHLRREVLRPGEVLLDVLAGTDRGWLFAVSCDTQLVRALPGEGRWEEVLAPLLAQLEHPFAGFDATTAQAVRDTLLGPVGIGPAALVASAATVFVCPDGALHRAPFSVLLATDDLRRLPSATILAHLRSRRTPDETPARVLAVAGRENAQHRRLAGAAAEVRRLRLRFGGVTVPGGARADTMAFGGADPAAFDVLHLACHGEVDPERPWNSSLVFGSADRPLRVRAGEVARLDLKARLAVLSSCGSAAGGILAGEGVLGLASGFLAAGVPSVVATLWPVDDATTARFVSAFYGALAAGQPAARALATGRAALRADPASSHPFYWAGFVLLGEGGGRTGLQPRPPYGPWLIGLTAALAAVVAWWARSRRATSARPR